MNVRSLAIVLGISIAFLGGRFSASSENSDSTTPEVIDGQRNTSSDYRSARRVTKKNKLPHKNTLGAGASAIKTTSEISELFKKNHTRGHGIAQIALGKMNSTELSELALDLTKNYNLSTPYHYQAVTLTFSAWAEIDPEAALHFAKSSKSDLHRLALSTVIPAMARQDPDRAYQEAKNIKNPLLSKQLVNAVLYNMASTNPDGWVEKILSEPQLLRSLNTHSYYMAQWFNDDPVAALARFEKLPSHRTQNAIPQIAINWANKDVSAALQWVNSLEYSHNKNQALGSVLGIMAKDNPEQALAMVEDLPAGSRKAAMSQIYKSMAKANPMATFNKAIALSNSVDRHTALSAIIDPNGYANSGRRWSGLSHWQSQNQIFSMEELQSITSQLPDGNLRKSALNQISYHLSGSSIEKTKEVLDGYSENDRAHLSNALIQQLYQADPEKALELYQNYPPSQQNNNLYPSIIGAIARTDPKRAMELALSAKTAGERSNSMHYIFNYTQNFDSSKITTLIGTIEDDKVRKQAISSAAQKWSYTNPTAALQWAHTLQDDEMKHALTSMIGTVAQQDPALAVKEFDAMTSRSDKGVDEDRTLQNIAGNLVSSWSQLDPEAAAKWVNTLPEGEMQNATVRNAVSGWVKYDFDKTAAWVDSFPEGKTRDTAVISLADSISRTDPATAYQWANSISDNSKRINQLRNTINQWKRIDPDKARAAIEQTKLTDKEYNRLIKSL